MSRRVDSKKIITCNFLKWRKQLFTKRERALIFSSLKKSSFLKLMLLLNFPIRWSSNWKKKLKIIIRWYLNRYYSMIFIPCYYLVSKLTWNLRNSILFSAVNSRNLMNRKTEKCCVDTFYLRWLTKTLSGFFFNWTTTS